ASLVAGSIVADAYGSTSISERHRHRYEVNNAYREALEQAGLVFSGVSPDGSLVEFIELPRDVHPFFAATQAHPELKSRPTRPHPLFAAFVKAAMDYDDAERLPVDIEVAAASALPSNASQSIASPSGASPSTVGAVDVAARA
ncbi:MAG: pyrG, partial [Pseudonocardiales bacterium]|nr:pyrG [Pseudonocardiales bacterium]